MPFDGTEFLNNPFEYVYSPFTDLFAEAIGNGFVFWAFMLVILTFGVYIKTQSAEMAAMFMIASSAVLGGGSIFSGAIGLGVAFIIFTAIGITALFIKLVFFRGE